MTYSKTTPRKSEPTPPTYHAYSVTAAKEGGKDRWTRIGVFFPHDDGQGGTLTLDALPIHFDGRIVLRTPKAE